MNPIMNDVFEIRLSEQTLKKLEGLLPWARFMMISMLVISIVGMINAYYGYKLHLRFEASLPPVLNFQSLASVVFLVVYALVLPVQGYYFLRFCVEARAAIRGQDSKKLNGAFRFLASQVIVFSLLLALNAVHTLIWRVTDSMAMQLLSTR